MSRFDAVLLREALQILADVGLSQADAAKVLGMPKGTLISRARRVGVRFQAEHRPGPGCDSRAAKRGWRTRRKAGWSWSRTVPRVTHLQPR